MLKYICYSLLLCFFSFTCEIFSQLTTSHPLPVKIKIPDTGQITSYTATFGEDADYLINPPSYTNNGDGSVTDNVTGLMWQKVDGGEMTIESATLYCKNLSLGSHTDWRLPTCHEAFSILNHDHLNPALDTSYFTKTTAEYWWTSERQSGDTTKVWVTNAGGGIGAHPKNETISAGGSKRIHVRAVRYTVPVSLPEQQYINNADGTITDQYTGLTWQRVLNSGTMTWENALKYAENFTLGGYTDWRLPNIKELQSLNDERFRTPLLDTAFFVLGSAANFWSSTTTSNQSARAWYNSFATGITTYEDKLILLNVICVRGKSTLLGGLNNENIKAKRFILEQNFPNPFNPVTIIKYIIPEPGMVTLKIFDISGQEIKTAVNEYKPIGEHSVEFDSNGIASGVYYYTLTYGSISQTKKMEVIK